MQSYHFFPTNTMIERELSIQISTESVEIKSLFFIDDTLDSIIIYNIMKKMIKKEILLQVPVADAGR